MYEIRAIDTSPYLWAIRFKNSFIDQTIFDLKFTFGSLSKGEAQFQMLDVC